jgi:hypothetical protein
MIHIVPSANKRKPYMVAKTGTIKLSNALTMHIHAGYLTDYASIPYILKLFLNSVGPYKNAFIVHDYMYNYRGYYTNSKLTHFEAVSRIQADKEMKDQMIKLGSKKWRANAYYLAVRLFGWRGFGKI